ncbi:TPR and ankyrin repeat-containing protein 1-like [Antedon mediterranea]|uniref:TPR and ankyrin repeat-containing protein 1-like n=1 Tax=Antedon mediterranea TaxID=105859 RepID=UPI003AF7B155
MAGRRGHPSYNYTYQQQQEYFHLNVHYVDQFNAHKETGNEANKHGHYDYAIQCYSQALEITQVIEVGLTTRDVAKVLSNRSLAFSKLGRLKEALNDGMMCLDMDKTWIKGYWRVFVAFKEMNKLMQALQSLVDGYSSIRGFDDDAVKDRADFMREIAILWESLKDMPKVQELCFRCTAPPTVWSKVVSQLAKQRLTKVLHRVFLKGEPYLPRGVGMATECDASSVNLRPLIRCMGPSDRNRYGMDLMLVLMKHGANWEGLSIKDGDTPLHVALNHCMEIANYDFLDYLFSDHATTKEKRSRKDGDGATLLHFAAKRSGKQRKTAVLFLLKNKVDPCVKDKSGKTAADYIDDWTLAMKVRTEEQNSKHVANQAKPVPKCSESVVPKTKQRRFEENPVLTERTRRPYSSPAASNTDYGFSKFSDDMPERERRPYSEVTNSKKQDKQNSRKKPQQNQNSQPNLKTKEKYKKQTYKKEQVNGFEKGCKLKRERQYSKALQVFLNVMVDRNPGEQEVENCKQEIINILDSSDFKEITQDVQSGLNPSIWDKTMLDLQIENRWRVMFLLLKGGGNNFEYGQGGLATGCDVKSVSIMKCLKSTDKKIEKIKIVKALLENGAIPNGLPSEGQSPVKYCLQQGMKGDNYSIITALIRKDAAAEDLVEVDGDGPLHAALRLCLKCYDKKMDLLKVLFDKYSKTKNDDRYLDPTDVNTRTDDTLFHIALNEKDEALSLEAIKLLAINKVNPYLKNKSGRIPITQIKRHDRRYRYLEEAARYHPKKGKRGPAKSKESTRTVEVAESSSSSLMTTDQDSQQKTKQQKKENAVTKLDKNELKRKIAGLIDDVLPVIKQAKRNKREVESERKPRKKKNEMENERTEEEKAPDITQPDEEAQTDRGTDRDLQEIDSAVFDNLTWEVECTAKVWKFLRDRHVLNKIKQAVVNKIRRLGEGDRSKSLSKALTHDKSKNIQLFEIKLTSGARILWQQAIAFSPKLSVNPEARLTETQQEFGGVTGGRIYAEVIRVWDVVPDHDNVSHAIDVILKSIDRGHECILQKKLRGLPNKQTGQATRIPNLYQEILPEDSPQRMMKKEDFFPPASSKETEYHIMKFYSFSSSLVNNILHDTSTRVDFPFRVTEKEHAIIHINPKPPCSLLLLGRSGTGKTTCCLYRLWSCFLKYWEMASIDCEPRIPRDFGFQHSKVSEFGNETDITSSDEELEEGAVANPVSQETDSEESDTEVPYDHLNQIFITKNRVLCYEVLKNFRDLAHGCNVATHYLETEDEQRPHRFQDAPSTGFPYFLNSRQFLLILDASLPGQPFFERNPDGSLKKEIRGWQEGDGQQPILDMMDMKDESDDDESDDDDDEDGEEKEVEFDPDAEEKQQKKTGTRDQRHEVTYEIFENNFWTKINKKNLPYHPTLVWMEIRSFIKGSIEALHSDKGKLELEGYQKLGKKRAPSFTGDRKEIFELFKIYEHMKKQRFYFDEADVVYDIYKRLQEVEVPDWAIHQIYVDETQDFTQAELALLIRCCSDPNAVFLTGDTAQSIMRGVAFRFDDLKSLFHYAKDSMKALGKQSAVAVPKKVYQLTHNYRSHAGILELAASVVDLLSFFFPTSFDRLKRDQGLFDGPKPVLLDSCSTSDLAMILRGNKRKTSEIEFGAHQVILVANDEAKKQLPEELSLALCLTIVEAKGLEFDDVMIYNFFKDSPAKDEWRVVHEHLNDIQMQNTNNDNSESNLFELDIDVMNCTAEQPRKLAFDPDKHKVLNSELKYLYTAISRARVNVWIFDEDINNRKPMFQYFKVRKLVQVLEAKEDLSSQSQFHDVMFVEKSSPEDWEKRGDYFYNNSLWEVALKCYRTAGNEEKVLKANASLRVTEAEKMKGSVNVSKMCDWYLQAAYDFLQCGMHNEAARCLFNSKTFDLSAQLFEKIGDVAGAAKIFETRLGSYRDASRCHEKRGDYATAVKVLKQNREFDKAADVVERYEQRKANNDLPDGCVPPRDNFAICCHRAAKQHLQQKAYPKMLEALNRLPNVDDRVTFLKGYNLHPYAVEILKTEGRLKEAAEILKASGDLLQAIELCHNDHLEFRAECHLKLAKQKMRQLRNFDLTKPIIKDSDIIRLKPLKKSAVHESGMDLLKKTTVHESGIEFLKKEENGDMVLSKKETETLETESYQPTENDVEIKTEEEIPSTDNPSKEIAEIQSPEMSITAESNNIENDVESIKPEGDGSTDENIPGNLNDSEDKEVNVLKEESTVVCEKSPMSSCQIYESKRKVMVEDVKKHAEESLKLLKISKGLPRLLGDCEFILAELNNDIFLLSDAAKHFLQASSDAGQMECFHLRLQLEELLSRKIVPNLAKIYRFVDILINYDGTKGQQLVNSAEHFYGLDLGANSQSQFAEAKFKQARLNVVQKHCLPKATNWFRRVKENLLNVEAKTQQCLFFATGRACSREECKHLHNFYQADNVLQLVDCFVTMIKLVHCAKQWKNLTIGPEDMQILIDNIIAWKHQPCSKLYDLVFPSHCNRRIATQVIEKHLYIIRQHEVKQEMKAWVLHLRDNVPVNMRNCNSDVYLKALNVHRLVEEDPNTIKQWMSEDEKECTKLKKLPLGIWFEKGKGTLSNMRRMLDYSANLNVSGDPLKAIGSCNRFLVFIAKRPYDPLIPSIANTVAIIEQAFTVACAVMAKVNRKIEVFLPASYLAQVQFQDKLCRNRARYYTCYQSVGLVENIRDSEILGQVRNFVELMICGDKYRSFDIISDAFSSRQDIESGEAERTLVLALVMLCNFRNLLNFDVAFKLRCQLIHIQTDEQYPPRLARAVDRIKRMTTLKDLTQTLQKLLMERDDEYLMACHWSSDRFHKLQFERIVTEHYKLIRLGSLEGMIHIKPIIAPESSDKIIRKVVITRQDVHKDSVETNKDVEVSVETTKDVDDDFVKTRNNVDEDSVDKIEDVDEDAEQRELFEEQKELFEEHQDLEKKSDMISKIRSNLAFRQKFTSTIMSILLKKGMLADLVLEQIAKEMDEDKRPVNDVKTSNPWFVIRMEEELSVDETTCGICRTTFTVKADETELRPVSPVEGEATSNYTIQREISITETKSTEMEEHVLLPEHIDRKKTLDEFKLKMVTQLVPLFEVTEKEWNHEKGLDIANKDLDYFINRIKEDRSRFNKTMVEIIDKRNWENFDELQSLMHTYRSNVIELSSETSKRREPTDTKISGATSNAKDDDNVAEQIREEADDEDQHQTLEVTKKKKGKGGRQRRKGNKKNK